MPRISESTVRRLSHYYRVLEEVEAEGGRLISSHRLAEREGVTSAQVRKDLSVLRLLRPSRPRLQRRAPARGDPLDPRDSTGRWRVGVVGVGNLGTALLLYRGFEQQGFDVVAGVRPRPGPDRQAARGADGARYRRAARGGEGRAPRPGRDRDTAAAPPRRWRTRWWRRACAASSISRRASCSFRRTWRCARST